jgi:integrase
VVVEDVDSVSAWVAELISQGPIPWWDVETEPERQRTPLSPSTVTKAGQVMGKIMGMAVRAGKLQANPCDGVKLPRVDRKEMRFLTTSEVERLADAMHPDYRAVVYLGAFGGLRAGEL